jgi:hypothetical protein
MNTEDIQEELDQLSSLDIELPVLLTTQEIFESV